MSSGRKIVFSELTRLYALSSDPETGVRLTLLPVVVIDRVFGDTPFYNVFFLDLDEFALKYHLQIFKMPL